MSINIRSFFSRRPATTDRRTIVRPTNPIEKQKQDYILHTSKPADHTLIPEIIFSSDDLLNDIELQKKDFLAHVGTPHEGAIPHSGRYPHGSGEKPYQHEDWFRGFGDQSTYYYRKYNGKFNECINELHNKQGMTYGQIAEMLGGKKAGITAATVRARASLSKSQELAYNRAEVLKMANSEPRMTNAAIGEYLGLTEGAVRSILKNNEAGLDTRNKTLQLVDQLKARVDEKGFVDVSEGNSYWINQTQSCLDTAARILKEDGYALESVGVKQVFGENNTTTLVLAKPGTTKSEIYKNLDKVVPVFDPEENKEATLMGLDHKPVSIDSDRIAVVYDEQGGSNRDGFIGIRRGVADLDLGKSNLAQVRIAVDGTHYIKGVAGYYDKDIPPGKDLVIYSNKHEGTPLTSPDPNAKTVLKPMKRDENGNIDEANPFGAMIKSEAQGGQSFYTDANGEQKLSAINKINKEGDWEDWSGRKYISSQMLSKQPVEIAVKQLDLAVDKRNAELENIKAVANPIIRKKLLNDYADSCDSAAVDLQGAAFPKQQTHVLVPILDIKDNECYAPNYKDGSHVILIRFPHQAINEIPYLTVNNKNSKEGDQIITKNSKDAIGITPKTAAQLSGADFDGDTVLAIPADGIKFNVGKPFKDLVGFDPKKEYPGYEGMVKMTKKQRGQQMGMVTNLITDMTAQGCHDEGQLTRAIKHSMVVIDAEKHGLDWKKSFADNKIDELYKEWQGKARGGAKTLIAKASGQASVPERKQIGIDPVTGEKIFRETGRTKGGYTNKSGKYIPVKPVMQDTTKMMKALTTGNHDARQLSSGTPMEEVYARYANQCHALGNRARKDFLMVDDKAMKVNPSAKAAYQKEIASISEKVAMAKKHAPLERQAQRLAGVNISNFEKNNPNIRTNDPERYKKVKTQYLTGARNRFGGGRKRLELTPKEWEAVDANAIPKTLLGDTIKYMDSRVLKDHVMKNTSGRVLTDAMKARIQRYASTGNYTNADIAEALGVSASTVSNILSGEI